MLRMRGLAAIAMCGAQAKSPKGMLGLTMMNEPRERQSICREPGRARKGPRQVNAWIAVCISVLFFAHACLGCALLIVPDFPTNLEWIVWAGVCAVCVHIVLSGVTTWAMFTDEVRPPSARKKSHQVKKWVTGVLLFLAVAAHAAPAVTGAPVPLALFAVLLAAAAVVLCVHVCTGVKSLTRDLNVSSSVRTPIRAAAVAFCVVIVAVLLGMLLLAF